MIKTINSQIENIKVKKKKTTPKRLIIISIVTLLIGAIFLTPYYHTIDMDGGTEEWRAIGYVVIKWQHRFDDVSPYNFTKVYVFPFSFLSVDALSKMEAGK